MSTRLALLRRSGTLRDGRSFLIRPTRSEDAHALVALRDAVAAEPGLIAATPGERTPLEEELSLAALLSEGGLSLVAEVDDALAAHLLVHRRQERYAAHVGDLAIVVSNTCRGEGLGRSLIEAALDWCRAVGVDRVCLSVFTSNEPAIALYRAMGFREEGVHRAHVRMPDGDRDLLLMALPL